MPARNRRPAAIACRSPRLERQPHQSWTHSVGTPVACGANTLDRPRERLAALGRSALTDAEVLAIVLGTGCAGIPVLEIARRLLTEARGVVGLARLSPSELSRLDGVGPAKAARLAGAFELGIRAQRPTNRGEPLTDSRQVFSRYGAMVSARPTECFWVLALDAKNRPLVVREVARGGRTSCQVDPAEVFRILLAQSASGAILLHNHPSGDPAPSPDDLALTERLARAGQLLQIRVLDHLVVGHGRYTSLRDAGLWPTPPAKSDT